MGIYINPKDCSKEEFLEAKGVRMTVAPSVHRIGDRVAVCLVDNGWMTAAAICYSKRELELFARPDGREKYWYIVPIDQLQDFVRREDIAP